MKQILIVEDDELLNKMLVYNLHSESYGIVSVETVKEAMEVLKSQPFDLVLLDINLPDGNGYEIAKTIGQRVRNYRIDKGLSQEKLAELSGCHPTYIGQVERGEKNATLESIEKIASAMNISLAQLFEKIGESSTDSYPMKCYELVAAKSKSEQEHLYKMLVEMDKYKNQ